MTNAEKFQEIFKKFATEVWAFPEKDFLTWLNAEYIEPTTKNDLGVEYIDRAELLKAMDTWDKFGFEHTGCFVREPKDDFVTYVHYDDMVKCVKDMSSVTPQQLIHGKCNQCKYYEGVHNAQGHAPCSYHKIGGVMWNWYCSQFENEVEE